MRLRSRPAFAAARRLLVRTGASRRPWQAAYAAAARAIAASFAALDRDVTVYVGGSVARGDVAAGLSDLDMVVVAGDADPLRLARHAARISRIVPGEPRQLLELGVCGEDELRHSVDRTALEPAPGDDGRLLSDPGWNVVADLHERPGAPSIAGAWRRLRGPERRPALPPATRARRRLETWLELQFWWKQALRAALAPDDPTLARLTMKLVSEPARAWLWLERHEAPPTREGVLARVARELPEEEEPVRRALELGRTLHRFPQAAVGDALAFLSRITARVAASLDADGEVAGRTSVTLTGSTGELVLPGGGRVPDDATPLADWRAVVVPRLPDEALLPVSSDASDPSALAAAARRWRPGIVPTLRADGFVVLATPPADAETMLRAVASAVTDPVSWAVLGGRGAASFAELAGWSAGDLATRAVAEHAGWLARPGSTPRRYLVLPDLPGDVVELARLLTGIRAALFAASVERGEPELAVTVAATRSVKGAEAVAEAVDAGVAVLRAWHAERQPPPRVAITRLRAAAGALPAYRSIRTVGDGLAAAAARRSA